GRGPLVLRVGFTARGARRARRSPQSALAPDVGGGAFPTADRIDRGAPLTLPTATGDMVTRVTWLRSSRCNGGSPLTARRQSGTMPPLAGRRRLRSTIMDGHAGVIAATAVK